MGAEDKRPPWEGGAPAEGGGEARVGPVKTEPAAAEQ